MVDTQREVILYPVCRYAMFVHVMKRTDATQHALESADHTASSRQHELLISIDNADSVGDGQIYNFSL